MSPRDPSRANHAVGPLSYAEVVLLADLVDDLERLRIATANRRAALVSEEWGKGIPEGQVAFVAELIAGLEALERAATRRLERAVAASPLGPFVAETRGLGAKSLGRLIGAIGDPAWNDKHSRPRKMRELYAYCGLHVAPAQAHATSSAIRLRPGRGRPSKDLPTAIVLAAAAPAHERTDGHRDRGGGGAYARTDDQIPIGVAPARRRGEKANWSAAARTRLWLIADSMVKVPGSAYRAVYDEGRRRYRDAVHRVPCRRCGPSGDPAPVGSPLNPGHQHARALRLVMKALLRDLWRAARAAHEEDHDE